MLLVVPVLQCNQNIARCFAFLSIKNISQQYLQPFIVWSRNGQHSLILFQTIVVNLIVLILKYKAIIAFLTINSAPDDIEVKRDAQFQKFVVESRDSGWRIQ